MKTVKPTLRRPHRPEYRALYALPAWKQLRNHVLLRDNYTCQWAGCGRSLIGKGQQPNAPVAHHIKDHKGDKGLFFDENNLMSVCVQCHNGPIQRTTHRGFIAGHDKNGLPLDPGHPWMRARSVSGEIE